LAIGASESLLEDSEVWVSLWHFASDDGRNPEACKGNAPKRFLTSFQVLESDWRGIGFEDEIGELTFLSANESCAHELCLSLAGAPFGNLSSSILDPVDLGSAQSVGHIIPRNRSIQASLLHIL
jgi:hypothetical protein